MDLSDMISSEEAAKILGYIKSSVALLCRQGKLEGAVKVGHQWFVPRKTIENYEKGAQGFAAVWQRRREAEKEQQKADDAVLEETMEGFDEANYSKEELEREILYYMKILARKIGRLEKIIAQEKANS